MSDNIIAASQHSGPSSGDGEQAPTLQGTPAARLAPVRPTTTTDTTQVGVNAPGVASTDMGSSTSEPAMSNVPLAVSNSLFSATSGSDDASTTSSGVWMSFTLPAATSTPLAVSETSAPLTRMPVALLQLAAAAGGSAATPLATSTLQTASTVQYTPALGVRTRPVPRLGAGTLLAPTVVQVPASIFNIRRGDTLVGMPDGLATPSQFPTFSKQSWLG
ncbi:hypothetical protein PR003_g18580 [Phytophthora rubi]|uniref:Uncharacterized protein n=1 Tax=Phytophthora rubi TaxID=129364 RepID=A0A6A4ECX2_9STRA|nr:hypothetical protein PR003_g18580 [Phytophthora rubi]